MYCSGTELLAVVLSNERQRTVLEIQPVGSGSVGPLASERRVGNERAVVPPSGTAFLAMIAPVSLVILNAKHRRGLYVSVKPTRDNPRA
jgi:hypothetical protein